MFAKSVFLLETVLNSYEEHMKRGEKMNIFAKIVRNMIEGRLLKVTFNAIKKFFKRIRAYIDWGLTIIPRLLLCYTSKVQTNKIMLLTFNHTYSCNPKYICEEIMRQELPVELVWAVTSKELKTQNFPSNIRLVVRGTYQFFKDLVTSKVWIDNAFGFTWNPIPKKKDQFYIQTWHGSLGLKRIGKEEVKNRRWSLASDLNARWVNLCVSNSTFETGVFRQTHWPKNPIEELGHARNDILFADDATKAAIRAKVCEYFEIPEDKKIILYAPTYRNTDSADTYDMEHSRILDALESRFGGEWVILNRYHFKTKKARKGLKRVIEEDERILSATVYPDIQELIVAADVGITDYSSWICDFMLTGRPGFLYTPDLADYDQERGFYYPLSETPFPIAETNDELEEKILSFDEAAYAVKNEQFLEARGCKENGTAAKQIVEIIKKQCSLA